MSFYLEDASGKWLGDLTNFGAVEILEDSAAPDSLRKFMDDGEADEELGNHIIEDLQDDTKYSEILEMLKEAEEFPVTIVG